MVYKIDFPEPELAVEWTLTESGVHREEVAYQPRFYVATQNGASFDPVTNAALSHPEVVGLDMQSHRPGWRHDQEQVLAIDVMSLEPIDRLAASIARLGRPGDFRLFNVDLSREFRYCLETGTDPTPSREASVLRLSAPPTAFVDGLSELSVSGHLLNTSRTITGSAGEVATEVESLVAEMDPDVLQVSESELVPLLFEAGEPGYQLGREPGFEQLAGESTFESYGQIGYSPARFNVPGRAIVDESNTFFLKETNLDGVLDMVSRSWKPLQEAAWASIGNILTAIQIRTALEEDVLVPWRAWRPEFYKDGRTLDEADRGGFTFAPDVGVHEDVHELDFSSLYPNIMVTRNISPETVGCECHPDREDVPGIGYNICPDDGYLPGVLEPLIEDRDDIKAGIRETDDPTRLAKLEGRSDAIKWILVSCFGYQGFSNAKFGRIECHESINAYAREILLDAKEMFEANGWRVVHGIVDSVWVQAIDGREQTPLTEVANEITDAVQIRLEYEAQYDWIAFCPRRNDNVGALTRYFGKRTGEASDDPESYKFRGVEARQRSTPAFLESAQRELVQVFDRSRSPEAVCDRLENHIAVLHDGDVNPLELAIKNRVSKPLEEYQQSTRNVAALTRANADGLDVHPGQDVEFVVVDDEKKGRDRVELLHEVPERYDVDFYEQELIRAAESILSPAGWREGDIRRYLADRVDGTISSFA